VEKQGSESYPNGYLNLMFASPNARSEAIQLDSKGVRALGPISPSFVIPGGAASEKLMKTPWLRSAGSE
jgi:hypothetical protein